MFEKEIKFIGDFCFNQVRSLGSNFTLDKIANAGVHPAIVQYISAELDFMIYSDRRKLLQQSYFDYAGKEILEHFQKISGEIKKHKKISLDDSKKLIFQAVSFNINYLVRPRWSLMKLIFNDQPVIPVEEMRMLLNYLYYYEYFKKVLNGYILKRNLVQISSTEFDILLNKIDNELLNSDQHQVMSNSFTSMGDFFNIGGVDKNRIPISAVEIFCKEKNLADLLLKLKKAIPNEVKRRYDKVEIERILFSPDSKKIIDEDAETEDDDAKTEKMIEALDADDSEKEVEEIQEEIGDESGEAEAEKFLSPEEEEALLSIYSEENNEESSGGEESVEESKLDLTAEEFKGLEVEGVKSALDMNLNVDSDIEQDEELQQNENDELDEIDSYETVSEYLEQEDSDETFTEEILSSEEELEGIVDAISDDLEQEEVEVDENIIVDIVESPKSEIENEIEQDDSETIESEIENEIVQEMISDYYGDENQNESEQEIEDLIEEEIQEQEVESVDSESEEKISSLEDDLLNIFEGLDKEEFEFSDKERFSVSEQDDFVQDEVEEKREEATFSSETTDGFDEYLKSIDEIVFTDNSQKIVERQIQTEVEAKVEEPQVEKEIEIEEPPEEVPPAPTKMETKLDNFRTLRPKDLFSYLRRKEVKKIVSYIFANDEEDFTNTAERIMDCSSYKEASDILKAVFTSYKISPYSKEAITFTNAVSNYFRQA